MTEMGFSGNADANLDGELSEGARDYLVPSRVHPGEILRASSGAPAI